MLGYKSSMKNLEVCEKQREELSPKEVNLPEEPQRAGALWGLPPSDQVIRAGNYAIPVQTDLTGKQVAAIIANKFVANYIT